MENKIDSVIKRTIIRDGLLDIRIHDDTATTSGLSILDLPFEGIWYVPLVAFTYVHCCSVLLEVARICRSPINHHVFNVIYFIDIILMATYKYQHTDITLIALTFRPYKLLLIELIATVPFYEFYPNEESFIYDILKLLQATKIIRVFYHFHMRHREISIGLWHRIIILGISMLFTSFVSITFIYEIYSRVGTDPIKQEWFNLFAIFEKLSTWGFAATRTDYVFEMIITSCILLDVYLIKAIILARVGNDFIMLNRHRYYFKLKVQQVLAEIKLLNAPKSLYENIIKYFADSWLYFKGYNLTTDNLKFLPNGLQTEILLDLYCIGFKHSKLFRNADVHLVRFLSRFCNKRIYQKNQYIFERGEIRSKMVYVVSGIVQIISEEDGETPIISLSSGTCLGESTLFVPYMSESALRCNSYTEVQELDMIEFSQLAILFPQYYRKLHREITERYREARSLKTMSLYFDRSDMARDDATITWIKFMSRQLLSADKGQEINLYLKAEAESGKVGKRMFTTKYLDLIVLSTAVELNETAEFFTTKFPLIINPDSFLLMVWNTFIHILIVCMLLLLPKYMFVEKNVSDKVMATFRLINYSFIFDLYIRICTAVKTGETILLTVNSIARYRMRTYGFIFDILAAIPLEMLACITLKDGIGVSTNILRVNKIFKAWHMFIVMSHMQQKLNVNMVLAFGSIFLTISLYLIYCWSYMFYYVNCNFNPYNCDYDTDYKTFFSAAQLVTGVGLRSGIDKIYHSSTTGLICYVSSSIIIIVLLMYIASSYVLKNIAYMLMETLKIELMNVIELYKIDRKLVKRLMRYLDGQLSFDDGASLIRRDTDTRAILSEEFKLVMEKEFSKQLIELKFFRDLPDQVLIKICSLINYTLLPPHEIVCYAGDMTDDVMYVLTKGVCEFRSKHGQRLSQGCEIINPLICMRNTPITHTCITKTHCLILSINCSNMLDIVEKHFMYMINLRALAEDALAPLGAQKSVPINASYDEPETLHKVRSFVTFGYKRTSDYHKVFDNTWRSKVIRYLLMRVSVHPNSDFMYYWELSRSLLAFLTNIAYGLLLVIISDNIFVISLLYFLDIVAYVDIYFRFHVGYFNEHGLLISHPYLTAKHYFRRSFWIDLIAVFPCELLFPIAKPWLKLIKNSTRVLQMHRYYGFLRYNERRIHNDNDRFYMCVLLPPLILGAIYFGSFSIAINCQFGNDIDINPVTYERGVYCDDQTWISQSQFSKPLSVLRVQLYGIYMAASVISITGIQGFSLETFKDGLLCSIMAILGISYVVVITARIILHHTRGSYDLSLYQSTLDNLKSYMIAKKVDKFIQRFAVDYYEFRWKRERGRNLCELLTTIHYTLMEDVLFNIYGESMLKYSIFSTGSEQFIKKILATAVHECLMIDCDVLRVNDICNQIYIIYKGFASIYLPDGTRLDVIGPGGIFGNLDKRRYNRIKVKVVSKTHLEVLHMDTPTFYRIIGLWPSLLQEFWMIKAGYMYYLPTKNIDTQAMEASLDKGKQVFKPKRHKRWIVNAWNNVTVKVFEPNSPTIVFWSTLHLLTCYISVFLYVTQVAFSSFGTAFVVCQYLCDTVYVIYTFYYNNHLNYENEKGIVMNDIRLIRKYNKKNRGSVLKLLIHLPYDLILFVIPNAVIKYSLFKLLRANRLLRYLDIYDYYRRHSDRVSLNIYVLEMCYIGSNTLLLFHTLTCLIIFVSTFFATNMTIYVPSDLKDFSYMDKLQLYMTYFYMIVSCICRVGIDSHVPDGPQSIIYTTVFVLFCPLIHSEIYAKDFKIIFRRTFLRKMFYDKLSALENLLNKQDVSGQIVTKTLRYVKLLWNKYEGVLKPYLLTVAPKHLQEYINCASYSFTINTHRLFKKCHIDFRRQLCGYVDFDLYFPGDYVTFKGSLNSTMYVIRKGEIEVIDEDEHWNERFVRILSGFNCFSIRQGLCPRVPQAYSYRALSFSVVLSLKYERWSHLLNFFPASKEIIYKYLEELTQDY